MPKRVTLINKLKFYGIHGVSLHWFKPYLSACDRFVSFNSKASDTRGDDLGVAQGISLGCLFLN